MRPLKSARTTQPSGGLRCIAPLVAMFALGLAEPVQADDARVARLVARTHVALDAGNLPRARRLLGRATAEAEADDVRVVRLAARMGLAGERADAQRALWRVVELDPTSALPEEEQRALWLARARLEIRLGELVDAYATLRRARQQDVEAAAVLQELAASAVAAEDYAFAARVLRFARRVLPQDSELSIDLALVMCAEGHPQQAVRLMLELLARSPDDESAAVTLAGALIAAGRTAEGVRVLERLAGSTGDADVALQLAWAILEAGEHERAIVAAAEARTLGADPVDCDRVLGFAAAAAGDDERAERALRRVLSASPDDATARALLDSLAP